MSGEYHVVFDPGDGFAPLEGVLDVEAVKVAMTQDKDGFLLKLRVNPNDAPEAIMRDWVGTRYRLLIVKLGDDDMPIIPENVARRRRLVSASALLCKNPRFWRYLYETHQDKELVYEPKNEEEAAAMLRERLGVSSRAEIGSDEGALERFSSMMDEFRDAMRS